MTKLRYLLVAVPLAGAGALWLGHSAPAAPVAAAPARALIAPGRVEPVHDPVKLAFEAQGRIAEILVDEGDQVHQGQLLARLDDRLARARIAAAEAGLAQAKARHQLARRGPRHDDIAAARAEADAAVADAEHRGAEQARSSRLGQLGALATTAVDADDAAARVSAAQAAAAQARYRSLASGTRSEQIDEAAAQVAVAQAELDAAQIALDQTRLVAPTGGVILRRLAELGALVTLTSPVPVLAMADLAALEIRTEIDEADIAGVSVGQAAYATADAYGAQRFRSGSPGSPASSAARPCATTIRAPASIPACSR